MHKDTNDQPADQPRPPRRRRRRRHGPRWTNPVSPLQATRFARRETGKEVAAAIRKICPGHGHGPCKLDVTKISDFESKRRRPSIEHIESFCRYYQKSPEELGLITWRDEPTGEPDAAAPTTHGLASGQDDHDRTHEQLVADWLRDSATSIAAAILQALVCCPVKLTGEELRLISGETLPGSHDPGEDDIAEDALPGGPAPARTTTQAARPDQGCNGAAEQTDGQYLSAMPQDEQPQAARAPQRHASEPRQ